MKMNFLGRCTRAASTIMLTPSDQITRRPNVLNLTSKNQAKLTIVNSIKISHSPRFNKKPDNCLTVFLLPTINAESPARKLNAGAQKWVIHLVKKMGNVL